MAGSMVTSNSLVTVLAICGFVAGEYENLPDQCKGGGYTEINNQWKRSAAYEMQVDDIEICDASIKEGWFVFRHVESKSYEDMPHRGQAPVDTWHCNTGYPIYLKDHNPYPTEVGKSVMADTCVRTEEDECSEGVTPHVSITNCGDFNVYYLKRPPQFCPLAYCFGTQLPCPEGQNSPTGYPPGCTANIPDPLPKPTVDWKTAPPKWRHRNTPPGAHTELVFTCNAPITDPTVTHVRVKWYMHRSTTQYSKLLLETYKVHEQKVPVTSMPAELKEKHWVKLSLGVEIKCQVSAVRGNNVASRMTSSDPFYAGLKIEHDRGSGSLVLDGAARQQTIFVRSTVPVLCPKEARGRDHCGFEVRLRELTGSVDGAVCGDGSTQDSAIGFAGSDCGVRIKALSDGRMKTGWDKRYPITVEGKRSDTYFGDGITAIRLEVHGSQSIRTAGSTFTAGTFHLWAQRLPDLPVKVVNEEIKVAGKLCYSHNDPHMRSFDGALYEMQETGTFVLYKHLRLPIQVQARYERCNNNRATCNCAVAVQSGKDVFIYDICKKKRGFQTVTAGARIGILGCDNKAMTTELNNGVYTITLPIGTKIIISKPVNYHGLHTSHSVKIYPTPLDWGAVYGLCGTLNGNTNDDFTVKIEGQYVTQYPANRRHPGKSFSDRWKIADESNANLLTRTSHVVDQTVYSPNPLCKCETAKSNGGNLNPESKVICEPSQIGNECVKNHQDHEDPHVLRFCDDPNRRKRDADVNQFTEDVEYAPEEDESNLEPSGWRNGWTETRANHYCRSFLLDNGAMSACSAIPELKRDFMIQGCVSDIEITGTTDFALASLQALVDECRTEVHKNNSMWIWDNDKVKNVPPTNILDKLCPNYCFNRGRCVNGECVCNDARYFGPDCGEDREAIPSDLTTQGHCDQQGRLCERALISGRHMSKRHAAPTCKLQEFTVNVNGEKNYTKVLHEPAEVLNHMQTICPLSSSAHRQKRSTLEDVESIAFGYEISLSNNGHTFSEQVVPVYVYDSLCVACDASTGKCQQKDDSCRIDGLCYKHGQINLNNPCQACHPKQSLSSWTTRVNMTVNGMKCVDLNISL